MPVAEGSENRFEPYEDVAAGSIPQEWPGIRSFRRPRCRDVGFGRFGRGASIGYQTLWVASAMLRPANTSPIRRIHLILGPIVGRQRASPEPFGPTTDIGLKGS